MPSYPVTLTVLPGRTGTAFLTRTFTKTFPTCQTIMHELLHGKITKPAVFHRAYDHQTKAEILSQPIIKNLLQLWQSQAEKGPVVDFGFTMSAIVPVFHDVLGDQLRVLVLHRHSIAVAASCATLGWYTQYSDERETQPRISPNQVKQLVRWR